MTPVHQLRIKPHQLSARGKQYTIFIPPGKFVLTGYTTWRDRLALTSAASFEGDTEAVKTRRQKVMSWSVVN